MSATTSPGDKFAFLFKTNNIANYNLDEVKNALINYYGFPPTNVQESTGCDTLTTAFQSFSDLVTAHVPTGKVPAGETQKNTVIIFIVGNADSSGLIDGTNPTINWSSLGYALDPVPPGSTYYYTNSEVHFYLIFPYCDTFYSSLVSFPEGSVSFPVTTNFAGFNGHASFISNWKNTFQDNAPLSFNSDKILRFDLAAARIFSFYSVSPSTLATFYKQKKLGVEEVTYSPFFPGRPSPEIDDGNPVYKTTDIWLNNLDPEDPATVNHDLYDNYEYDHDNKISVRVHFRGTHPVNTYYVGVGVFRSGGGGECDVNPLAQRLTTSAALLKPGDTQEYFYNEFFESIYSHRCIKARVSLTVISDTDIDNDTDWLIGSRENEAQLNIDQGGLADISAFGTGTGATIVPGEGTVDETDPADAADPDTNGTGSKSTVNLRGYLEHVYLIKNRFKTTMEFRYRIPDIIHRYENLFRCRWFVLDLKYPGKMHELELNRMTNPWFSFILRPGEQVEIMTYLAFTGNEKIKKRIDLPFEILVEKLSKNTLMRLPFLRSFRKEFRLFSGVNLVLSEGSGDIIVKVLDEKKNSVPEAFVFIKTLNGRQSAVYRTGKDGSCMIPKINTGPYKLWATKDNWKSETRVINLQNRKTEKAELMLKKK